jgi:ATP-dependent HslUV protease ATP-binding subunit HslU
VRLEKERRRIAVRDAAEEAAMERLLDALTGKGASEATRESFRRRFHDGHLADSEIEIDVSDAPNTPFEIPGMGGQVGMINLSDMMSKAMGQQPQEAPPPQGRRSLAEAGRGGSGQAPRQ